ncbi:MAG: TadE/TadG family type IV pilus assembly protein [Boseongicola sp.]
MLNRVGNTFKNQFSREEDGALLVFFAICVAAVFLISALSFDLGRRSSTQTELQSFADNVALASAGELNGFPGAISRASTAADQLISDSFVFGDEADGGIGQTLSGVSDYSIFFYEDLPADDLDPLVGALDVSDPTNDFIARFVRIQANEVDVPWVFANLLTIFSSDPLPDEAVSAEAVAGFTSLACDIAPVFFCLPDPDPADGDGLIWDPKNHIGEQVLLRTGQGGNSFWDSGNFGWLDPRDTIPDESLVDSDGECAGLNGTPLLVCLIAAENGVVNCFENGLLETLPGQKQGIESAVFNTRFDMFNATVSQYADNPTFQPAPIITRGFVDSGGDECIQGGVDYDVPTMAFPQDDCFTNGNPGGFCEAWNGEVRFGDGVWDAGRMLYAEANYSIDGDSYDTGLDLLEDIIPGDTDILNYPDGDNNPADEVIDVNGVDYHVHDPFRPGNTNGYPELPYGASRWEYYVAEVMATYYTNPVAAYNSYINNPGIPIATALIDPVNPGNVPSLMPLLEFDVGPDQDRVEYSLPLCATDPSEGGPNNFSLDPRRRVVVAAIVDCTAQQVKGNTKDVLATYFVESFISTPVKGDPSDKKKFDMWIEPIGPALNSGQSTVQNGTFRNLVQIYR